jgi:hypothetical protein
LKLLVRLEEFTGMRISGLDRLLVELNAKLQSTKTTIQLYSYDYQIYTNMIIPIGIGNLHHR